MSTGGEGVTLTPGEAQDAADALAYCSDLSAFTGTPEEDRYRALAERLEEMAFLAILGFTEGSTP